MPIQQKNQLFWFNEFAEENWIVHGWPPKRVGQAGRLMVRRHDGRSRRARVWRLISPDIPSERNTD
jgi:hypothetical protein